MADAKSAVPPGVWCPVISIYKDEDQSIDLDASEIYFSHLIRGGINGLVLQGSTAEAALLSPDERISLIKNARNATSNLGVPSFPIVAGVSGQSTRETLKLVDDAATAGADFGLLLPPSYWAKAVTTDTILEFYADVADRSRIPIIVYNVSIKILISPFKNADGITVPWCHRWDRPGRRRPVGACKASQYCWGQIDMRERRQGHFIACKILAS